MNGEEERESANGREKDGWVPEGPRKETPRWVICLTTTGTVVNRLSSRRTDDHRGVSFPELRLSPSCFLTNTSLLSVTTDDKGMCEWLLKEDR